MSCRLYIDIETLPDQRPGAFDKYVQAVQPPGNYKKQESIDAWLAENAERVALEDYRKTALSGLRGEICSIAWALDNGEIQSLTRADEDEAWLIRKFWVALYAQASELSLSLRLEWVGHNVIGFDLRYLKQRSIINNVQPVFHIPAESRHGNGQVFDTMVEWCGQYSSNRYVKQDELCEVMGIEPPAWAKDVVDVDGSGVFDMWTAREYDKIGVYNKLDVYKVREIHKRMVWI